MKIDVVPVVSKTQRKTFIDFPHSLYQSDPFYVPELFLSQKEMFDEKKYPFYEFGEVESFLAIQGDKVVGRICAIDNRNYNKYHQSNVGFFGFFDVVNDFKVAKALLDTAKKWVSSKGRSAIIGPTNFSTNETAGILVDGFDSPPKIMMTYNKDYYESLLTQYGFEKEMDLFAYMIESFGAAEKSIRLSKLLEDRMAKRGITIRSINKKDFKKEVESIKLLYNAAWEKNWGFVPFTDAEFKHLAAGLKMLADPRWCYIAEKDSVPIGFSISVPNLNEVLIDIPRGRLLPTGIFKLLWRKNKYKNVRILALGVLEEYRNKGIEAIFFAKNILQAQEQNLIGGEASWVLENNTAMCQAAEKLNGKKYKTYRLFRLPLD